MVTVIVVVIGECVDPPFQIAGQVVVFQQNPVLHGLVPTLDLALGPRTVRCSSNVVDALGVEMLGQIGSDAGRNVAAEKVGLLHDGRAIAT